MTEQQWQTLEQSLSNLSNDDKCELANRLLHSIENPESSED